MLGHIHGYPWLYMVTSSLSQFGYAILWVQSLFSKKKKTILWVDGHNG